jgi:hypothetical protein
VNRGFPVPKSKDNFETVRKIGLALRGVEAGTAYGSPALKLRGKLMACIAIHPSAEPNTLALQVGFEERDALIAEQPDVYYVEDHYVNYPTVLVRLSHVNEAALRDLLAMSHKFVTGKLRRASPKRNSRKP